MLSQTATHATLLARVSSGEDPAAWAEFCARYGHLIRAFCRRRGLQEADTDDVQQEVLLNLSRSMPGFRYDPSKGKFRSYLKTVVLHAIFRRAGQNHGEQALEVVEERTRAASADAEVDAHWEAEWRQYHLRAALAALAEDCSERDLTAFERYAVRGEDPALVASALGLSMDQIYQIKSRLLRRLTEQIEHQVDEEG